MSRGFNKSTISFLTLKSEISLFVEAVVPLNHHLLLIPELELLCQNINELIMLVGELPIYNNHSLDQET